MSLQALSGMERGLDAALALARATAPRHVRQALAEATRTLFGLTRVDCWVLTADQRALVLDDDREEYRCDDFRHPYSHAMRSDDGMRLVQVATQPRLDHPGFQRQVAAMPARSDLYLLPLKSPERTAPLGLLACWGSRDALNDMVSHPGTSLLMELALFHWHARQQHDESRLREKSLRTSLVSLREDERRRSAAEQLGDDLTGRSPVMIDLRQQVVRAAETSMAVLLQGETGTGKDVVARALHRCSPRADAPFVAINCAAIPASLLESELFGHVKGAFSGAGDDRQGLINEADGGTLFLDEIGDMPLELQAKLLRVLESGHYRPLGAAEERCSSFRLIAATHQPMRERIREGAFRADLYYRLGQFPLTVPPLKAREGDVELLARTFVHHFCVAEQRPLVGLSSRAVKALESRDYPGNVRELKNVVEYACAMTPPGQDVDAAALQQGAAAPAPAKPRDVEDRLPAPLDEITDLRDAARRFEASVIEARLAQFEGNRALTAESLNLPKRTLAHKCQQFRIGEE